jgi:hypothetical protein
MPAGVARLLPTGIGWAIILRRGFGSRLTAGITRVGTPSEIGRRFAYREHVFTPGEPVRPVELVRTGPPRSNKVRIRWLDYECERLRGVGAPASAGGTVERSTGAAGE